MTQKQPDHKVDHKQQDHKTEPKAEHKQPAKQVEPPEGFVTVCHPDPSVTLSYNGELYESKGGKFYVPEGSLDDIAPHGFYPC